MNDKASVRIMLESDVDGEKQAHQLTGEWYRKDRTVYIRYEERDETYGEVRTTVRWREGELRLTRHGGIEAEQNFAAGQRLPGRYKSEHATFPLETETLLLWMQTGDESSIGTADNLPRPSLPLLLEWRYKLWVGGESVGLFRIRLLAEAEEVPEAPTA
ncbi:DUF1934 domain-containing protein [Paenibacillus aurantiacus]|uniref:DUF1934 domain-containing protein n=1 Tax=Paenibacillus aurantiacus TaxID=1936118 RepID=A0ABV5L322_9BACL